MPRRMPILREHHVWETSAEPVGERDDFVAASNRHGAARAEVVLDIDDEQYVAVADSDLVGHSFSCQG